MTLKDLDPCPVRLSSFVYHDEVPTAFIQYSKAANTI